MGRALSPGGGKVVLEASKVTVGEKETKEVSSDADYGRTCGAR